jgi:uncharacterized membrane protein
MTNEINKESSNEPEKNGKNEPIIHSANDIQTGDKNKNSELVAEQYFQSLQGPLPPPEDFALYNQILPGSAKQILDMATKEQNHRISQESKSLDANIIVTIREQIFGFILALSAIAAAIILIMYDKDLAGGAIFVAALGSLIINAFYGHRKKKKKKKKDHTEKNNIQKDN